MKPEPERVSEEKLAARAQGVQAATADHDAAEKAEAAAVAAEADYIKKEGHHEAISPGDRAKIVIVLVVIVMAFLADTVGIGSVTVRTLAKIWPALLLIAWLVRLLTAAAIVTGETWLSLLIARATEEGRQLRRIGLSLLGYASTIAISASVVAVDLSSAVASRLDPALAGGFHLGLLALAIATLVLHALILLSGSTLNLATAYLWYRRTLKKLHTAVLVAANAKAAALRIFDATFMEYWTSWKKHNAVYTSLPIAPFNEPTKVLLRLRFPQEMAEVEGKPPKPPKTPTTPSTS